MTKFLEGMARAYETSFLSSTGDANTRAEAIRAALLWLAEQYEKDYRLDYNIFVPTEHPDGGTSWEISGDIAAALRQAAGGGDE